jgi:hypothetical protein
MAGEEDEREEQGEEAHGPRECMPCRGSGQVISNLGGQPERVRCPWCGGSGIRGQIGDAQARWLEQGEGGGARKDGPPDTAA